MGMGSVSAWQREEFVIKMMPRIWMMSCLEEKDRMKRKHGKEKRRNSNHKKKQKPSEMGERDRENLRRENAEGQKSKNQGKGHRTKARQP